MGIVKPQNKMVKKEVQQTARKASTHTKPRVHVRALVLGNRRNHHNQDTKINLLKIHGVADQKDTQFYIGKRVAYVYKAQTVRQGVRGVKSNIRVIWSRIVRAHGTYGAVRARFRTSLPSTSFGK